MSVPYDVRSNANETSYSLINRSFKVRKGNLAPTYTASMSPLCRPKLIFELRTGSFTEFGGAYYDEIVGSHIGTDVLITTCVLGWDRKATRLL